MMDDSAAAADDKEVTFALSVVLSARIFTLLML